MTRQDSYEAAEKFLNSMGWVLMADIGGDRDNNLIEHWIVSKWIAGEEVSVRAASIPEVIKRAIAIDDKIEHINRFKQKVNA